MTEVPQSGSKCGEIKTHGQEMTETPAHLWRHLLKRCCGTHQSSQCRNPCPTPWNVNNKHQGKSRSISSSPVSKAKGFVWPLTPLRCRSSKSRFMTESRERGRGGSVFSIQCSLPSSLRPRTIQHSHHRIVMLNFVQEVARSPFPNPPNQHPLHTQDAHGRCEAE